MINSVTVQGKTNSTITRIKLGLIFVMEELNEIRLRKNPSNFKERLITCIKRRTNETSGLIFSSENITGQNSEGVGVICEPMPLHISSRVCVYLCVFCGRWGLKKSENSTRTKTYCYLHSQGSLGESKGQSKMEAPVKKNKRNSYPIKHQIVTTPVNPEETPSVKL